MATHSVNPGAPIAPSILNLKTSQNGHKRKKSAAPTVPVESVQPEPVVVNKQCVPPPPPESTRDQIAKSLRESKIEHIACVLSDSHDSTVDFLNEVFIHFNSNAEGRSPSELIRCFDEIAEDHKPKAEEAEETELDNKPVLMGLEDCITYKKVLELTDSAKSWLDDSVDLIKYFSSDESEVRKFRSNYLAQCVAELNVLNDILNYWQGREFNKDYPDELPLIASIKGTLDL